MTGSQVALQKSLADLKAADGLAADYLKDKAMLEAKIFKINAEKDILEKAASSASSGKRESTSVSTVYLFLYGEFWESSFFQSYRIPKFYLFVFSYHL